MDLSQDNKFAASPIQYECSFFSWANIDGHNPISDSEFEYDWGAANAEAPWYQGQPYGNTRGASVQTNIDQAHDAARMNLGWPWRMPSVQDFQELLSNVDFVDTEGNPVTAETSVSGTENDKRVRIGDIVVVRLKSRINGAILEIAASGYGASTDWNIPGQAGYLWTTRINNERTAKTFGLDNTGVRVGSNSGRHDGVPIRPVF